MNDEDHLIELLVELMEAVKSCSLSKLNLILFLFSVQVILFLLMMCVLLALLIMVIV
jgi:hypothetical protein